MRIIWTEKAIEDFENNINYLIENWGYRVVRDFTTETERLLNTIMLNPRAFQFNGRVKCHVVPVTKQITLFYEINNRHHILLLRFWNNLQNPRKLTVTESGS